MSNLPQQPDDELLSAYLDGELAADELHAVEDWLASDPAAQTLLDELRSVSRAVQALPKQAVPEEWSAKLTKRLNEAAAQGDAHPKQASQANGNHRSNGQADATPRLRIGRSTRGWWWSAAAIAAAVAIMVMLPRETENEVATNMELGKAPASAREPLAMRSGETDMRASDGVVLDGVAPRNPGSGERRTNETPAVDEMLADRERLDDSLELGVDAVESDTVVSNSDSERSMRERESEVAATESTPMESLAESAPAPIETAELSLTDSNAEGLAANTYFIVWADVPPETLREREINNLFVGNGIAVDDRTVTWTAAAEPVRQQIELRNSINVRGAESFGLGGGGGGFGGGGEFDALASRTNSSRANSSRFSVPDTNSTSGVDEAATSDESTDREGEVEVDDSRDASEGVEIEGETILVDATADQIAACLVDMQRDTGNFRSIVVEPVNEAVLRQQFANQSLPQQAAMRSLAQEQGSEKKSDGQTDQTSNAAGAGGELFGDYRRAAGGQQQLADTQLKRDADRISESLDVAQEELEGKQQPSPVNAQMLGKQQAQARRLNRPEQWYFYNTAPQESWAGYKLQAETAQASKDKGKAAIKLKAEPVDKREQLAGLNRYVIEQQKQVAGPHFAGQIEAPPLTEQQQVQVLFVLRNDKLPAPTGGRPALASPAAPAEAVGEVEPAESP